MAEFPQRMKIEQQFEKRFEKLSTKHQNKLKKLLGNPPDYANVPGDFWEEVRREQEEELMALLMLVFMMSASNYNMSRQQASAAALGYASGKAKQISQGLSKTSRSKAASYQVDPSHTPKQARDAIVKLTFPKRKALDVASTETTAAASAGSDYAVQHGNGVSQLDRWRTERDGKVCPICRPLDGKPREEWERFFPKGPPAHPRCRCDVEYANQSPRNRGVLIDQA